MKSGVKLYIVALAFLFSIGIWLTWTEIPQLSVAAIGFVVFLGTMSRLVEGGK